MLAPSTSAPVVHVKFILHNYTENCEGVMLVFSCETQGPVMTTYVWKYQTGQTFCHGEHSIKYNYVAATKKQSELLVACYLATVCALPISSPCTPIQCRAGEVRLFQQKPGCVWQAHHRTCVCPLLCSPSGLHHTWQVSCHRGVHLKGTDISPWNLGNNAWQSVHLEHYLQWPDVYSDLMRKNLPITRHFDTAMFPHLSSRHDWYVCAMHWKKPTALTSIPTFQRNVTHSFPYQWLQNKKTEITAGTFWLPYI